MRPATLMSAATIRRAVTSRELSAVEVCKEHLARVEELNPSLGALLCRLDERALRQAAAVDRRVASGESPALAGVPVVVKDVLAMEGLPTTCGSRILEGYRPPFTATAVDRLEREGAVVIGKANMDEFAMGSSTENSAYFPARNPWDPDRVPGGSSGGSAVAVAASMAPIALGTDTGGSIRQPAAFCGLVGLKPTWGRVSRYGLVAYASSLDQVGPLARNTEDCALVAEVLFGHDPADSTSSHEPVPQLCASRNAGIAGLRVGVPWAFLERGVALSVLSRFREALGHLEAAGAEIVAVNLPHLPHAIATYYIVATAEASSNLARFDGVRYGLRVDTGELRSMYGATRDRGFGPEVKRRIILGTYVLSSGYYDAYYLRAQKVRTLIRRDFDDAFGACDVVATPTTPTTAFRLGEKTADPLEMYLADIFTVPANLAGLPGLSVPSGLAEGLPTGLQLLGKLFDERTLLQAGAALERAVGSLPCPSA